MSSAITTPPLNPSGGETTREFHCFPKLPAELRIRIWQIAYDAIPDTFVYRFRLEFSSVPDPEMSDKEEEAGITQAFLVPLEEVRDLTRELRSLRKVNIEARCEGESLFDGSLRLNQTKKGGTTDLFPPISLPWKARKTVFCFVDLNEFVMDCLYGASTVLIDQIFSTVQLLGFGMDRTLEYGFETSDNYNEFKEFILRFTEIRHVALVSDRLMSQADLENINDDLRSTFTMSCWDDWVGRVQEDVIGSHCDKPKIVTKEEHLEALTLFTDCMLLNDIRHESVVKLRAIDYGMVFRTEEDLLLDDFTLGDILGMEMMSDVLSDGMLSEQSSEWDESS